ncbi:hypothetical protein GCM10018987_26230 [Streptomyces cremeus]
MGFSSPSAQRRCGTDAAPIQCDALRIRPVRASPAAFATPVIARTPSESAPGPAGEPPHRLYQALHGLSGPFRPRYSVRVNPVLEAVLLRAVTTCHRAVRTLTRDALTGHTGGHIENRVWGATWHSATPGAPARCPWK